ncbi:MAG: hypothetical protein CTY12_00635 [Methylotenera sp.]|nr:MAG: hypothetical protein CTY12_00635 [Methylotenera sp.]
MPAKIKKIIRHDSLSVKADFPTGESIKFKVNRGGESYEYASKAKLTAAHIAKLDTLFKFLPEEINSQRIDRLGDHFSQFNSVAELVA